MAAEQAPPVAGSGLRPAFAAVRVRIGLVLALFGVAAAGWWWTVRQMQGMDEGPWTALGTFGWFLGVWVVMMAAMMFPSVAPTVALYSRMTKTRHPLAPAAFTAGYLLTWAAAGVAAWTIAIGTSHLAGDALAWDNAGRVLAGATVVVAAVYELTPFKDVCLGKCRSPLGLLLGTWRDGLLGGMRMGATNGAWCVGCCWALMASLFALGVMSITWMAFVAGLIAIEKTLPWRRVATYATAAVLLVLGVLILASPHTIPWLGMPGRQPMQMMTSDRPETAPSMDAPSGR
jgi:predicted metal-binding membrane protein